ncbi:hypothetical protein BYT27DRAFT_7224881 [Phlegmacium glaucopus]|nr:hypothetical protein BYT27DRAFT_7224881 [Phlegmacium glaucopus]
MTNFHYIPDEQKKLILTMHLRGMCFRDIETATGIGIRTIQRIKRSWLLTGKVVNKPLEPGRHRCLTSLEVSYLESLIEQRPDIYMKELQHALFVAYNVEVDGSNITRALHRRGFTRKKVLYSACNFS